MSNITKPYTIFGETKNIPLKVYHNGNPSNITEWDIDLWIERPEDWYALLSANMKKQRVRIIEKDVWTRTL